MMKLEELAQALGRVGSVVEAPEAHGVVAGAACAGEDQAGAAVLEILGDGDPNDAAWRDAQERLATMALDIHRGLQSEDFSFQPLLAPDEAPLARRADSLAQWCQGFLYGLTLGGYGDFARLPGELPELMADLREIAYRFGPEVTVGESAEEEGAYAELVEYVRVGAMLTWAGLRGAPPERPGGG